jgi:hypothetical protein
LPHRGFTTAPTDPPVFEFGIAVKETTVQGSCISFAKGMATVFSAFIEIFIKIAGFERFFRLKLKQNGFPTPYIG